MCFLLYVDNLADISQKSTKSLTYVYSTTVIATIKKKMKMIAP